MMESLSGRIITVILRDKGDWMNREDLIPEKVYYDDVNHNIVVFKRMVEGSDYRAIVQKEGEEPYTLHILGISEFNSTASVDILDAYGNIVETYTPYQANPNNNFRGIPIYSDHANIDPLSNIKMNTENLPPNFVIEPVFVKVNEKLKLVCFNLVALPYEASLKLIRQTKQTNEPKQNAPKKVNAIMSLEVNDKD